MTAKSKLINVFGRSGFGWEVVEQARRVRRRIEIQQLDRVGIEAICRNDVPRKRLANESELRSRRIRSARCGNAADRVRNAASNRARRGRIENLSECVRAPESVGARSALSQQF